MKDILVISDSEAYVEEVKSLLADEDINIHSSIGAKKGLEMAKKLSLEGVILDIVLKGTDGIEVCLELKSGSRANKLFVLFYTDEDEEYIQIAGLNSGADDYIIRPVHGRVLLSRIRALLKRKSSNKQKHKSHLICSGDITIDLEKYTVSKKEENFIFPRKEFELLCLLVSKPGKVYSRAEISNSIWGEEKEIKGRTIDVHIRKIRGKLGNSSIRTIKGIGYKWTDSVNI